MCRYFLEQLGSGHSIKEGDPAGACVAGSIVVMGLEAPLELDRERLASVSTGLGPLDDEDFLLAPNKSISLAGLLGGPPELPPPRRPLAPLRSFECIGLMSFIIIRPLRPAGPLSPVGPPRIGVPLDAPLPRLALPLGALDSASLVGESHNLFYKFFF